MQTFIFLKRLTLTTTLFFSYPLFAESNYSQQSENPQIESIYDYSIDEHGIGFRVSTGGCTCKKSFDLTQKLANDGTTHQLTLVRMFPDHCKGRFPEGTFVWYSFEELKLNPNAKLQIENPYSPDKP